MVLCVWFAPWLPPRDFVAIISIADHTFHLDVSWVFKSVQVESHADSRKERGDSIATPTTLTQSLEFCVIVRMNLCPLCSGSGMKWTVVTRDGLWVEPLSLHPMTHDSGVCDLRQQNESNG